MNPLIAILLVNVVGFGQGVQLDDTIGWKPDGSIKVSASSSSVFSDHHLWRLSLNPIAASMLGFHQFDGIMPDISIEAMEAKTDYCLAMGERVRSLLDKEKSSLGQEETFYLKVLLRQMEDCISGLKFRAYLFTDISSFRGVQTFLPMYFKSENFSRLDDADGFRLVLNRLEGVAPYIDQIIELSRRGIRAGITFPRESMTNVSTTFEKVIEKSERAPTESDFYQPFVNMSHVATDEANEIRAEALQLITSSVAPAFKKLRRFVLNEYLRSLRKESGLSSLADGQNFYKACLQYYTTIRNISASGVHQTGLDTIAQLQSELQPLADRARARSVLDYIRDMQNSPDQRYSSADEILEHARSIIRQRINPKLNTLFEPWMLTEDILKLQVQPGEAAIPIAYYRTATKSFHVSTDVSVFRPYQMLSLSLHEANPGHHMHITFLHELSRGRVPQFILNVPGSSYVNSPNGEIMYWATIEGWGLYAEYLGRELGLNQDDSDLFGLYSLSLLRAARLVVDTGLHAFGWSRQRAIDYMVMNTGFSQRASELEVDRYITWPGQATSYYMGFNEILRIRSKKEAEMGKNFDIKLFHTDVFMCYGPLDMLEECIDMQSKIRQKDKSRGSTTPKSKSVATSIFNHVSAVLIACSLGLGALLA